MYTWFTIEKQRGCRTWRRNAAGVDSVQAQGMVGCRPGIVGVDYGRDGCMALEGTVLESKAAKTHEDPVKLLRIR